MKNRNKIKTFKILKPEFLKWNCLRNEMFHFVSTLLRYVMVEVIESEWNNFFHEELPKAKDFDEIIAIHEKFLNNVLKRAIFSQGKN